MTTKIVGFPLADIFMDRLMGPRPPGHDFSKADYSDVIKAGCATHMSDALSEAIAKSGLLKDLSLRMVIDERTSRKYRPVTETARASHEVHNGEEPCSPVPLEGGGTSQPHTYDFEEDGLVIIVKPSWHYDPVLTEIEAKKKGYCERREPMAEECLSEIVACAKQIFTRQQRTHLFQLVIIGQYGRLARFDRAGVIFSRGFHYGRLPDVLSDFLWRYSNMTDAQRGVDVTASTPLPAERDLFTKAVGELLANMDDPQHEQLVLPDAKKSLDASFPIRKICVSNTDGDPRNVLVQSPFYASSSLHGRATRVYLAYDLKEERIRCLKDSWRLEHPLLLPENEIYASLSGIEHIPQNVVGGDVSLEGAVQKTVTQEWSELSEEWRMSFEDFNTHTHTRVLQEVLYPPIQNVRNSKQWVIVLYHCMKALLAAYAAGVQHRDISIGNVLMDKDHNGQLADWDHGGLEETARSSDIITRMGTWAYMSIALLGDFGKKSDILDDLEALFWVLLDTSFNGFANNNKVDSKLFTYASVVRRSNGAPRHLGGHYKERLLKEAPFRLQWECKPLQELISQLCDLLRPYYQAFGEYSLALKLPKQSSSGPKAELREKTISEARENFQNERDHFLGNVSLWTHKFEDALKRDDWLEDDAIPSRCPRVSAETGVTILRERTVTPDAVNPRPSNCEDCTCWTDSDSDSDDDGPVLVAIPCGYRLAVVERSFQVQMKKRAVDELGDEVDDVDGQPKTKRSRKEEAAAEDSEDDQT